MPTEEDAEAAKEDEYNTLASNLNGLLTELHTSEDKFKKLKREFEKKIKEISSTVEDEENRASSFFSIDSQRLSGKHNVFQRLSICLSARFLKNLHVCTHLLQRLSQKHITFTYIYLPGLLAGWLAV
jgi:hypothetical protein